MSQPVLITGAAGGRQGSTGRVITSLLLKQGILVRAFVRKNDDRSEELKKQGAEIFVGDLLDPASVQEAIKGVKRAYFTYPVNDGLLEATSIFASMARDANLELVVNNSQYQGIPGNPDYRNLLYAPSPRNLEHRLADRIFDWSKIGVVHIQTPPYYENVRALVSQSVAQQDKAFLPWGDGDAVYPLTGAEDVALVAATLLTNPGLPRETVYTLVTETQTVQQIIETLSRALGRPIRYIPITDEQWANAVRERINPHGLEHLSNLWKFFRNNKERRDATNAIREITGREPQTLEEFFRANAKSFEPAGA
jgi:uncharacterized protein YbjT (DUF2867 family)